MMIPEFNNVVGHVETNSSPKHLFNAMKILYGYDEKFIKLVKKDSNLIIEVRSPLIEITTRPIIKFSSISMECAVAGEYLEIKKKVMKLSKFLKKQGFSNYFELYNEEYSFLGEVENKIYNE